METENKVILQLSGTAASDDELVEELYKLYRLFKKRRDFGVGTYRKKESFG